MAGILYGVGVGPGDPELMTLKAVRLIRETQVIAVPGKKVPESVAFRIAVQAVPEMKEKELVAVEMPMIKDRSLIGEDHKKGAALLETYLDKGQNVVFLTLGDPMVYSTFTYLEYLLEKDGYQVEPVSGITSFCAAAARLKLPLAEWDEPLHIVPAVHKAKEALQYPGNYILMKSGSQLKEVKGLLKDAGLEINAVENCTMENEKLYRAPEEIPDDAGYFSLLIAKPKKP